MVRRLLKTVRLPIQQTPVRVAFAIRKYPNNNTAIEVLRPTLLGYRDWDILTVNTGAVLPPDTVCIDTNHHGEEIIAHLEKLNLGVSLGARVESGFCKYPIFQLNYDKLKKYLIKPNAKVFY